MNKDERKKRTFSIYESICEAISKLSKGEELKKSDLLLAVSQLQSLLINGYDMNPDFVCKMFRDADKEN